MVTTKAVYAGLRKALKDISNQIYYEPTIAILEYVAKNPNKTIPQIMEGLEGKVTLSEFSGAEDILSDCNALKYRWGKTKTGWGNVFRVPKGTNVNHIKQLLEKVLPRKK